MAMSERQLKVMEDDDTMSHQHSKACQLVVEVLQKHTSNCCRKKSQSDPCNHLSEKGCSEDVQGNFLVIDRIAINICEPNNLHAEHPVIRPSKKGMYLNREEMFGVVEPVKSKIDALPIIPKTNNLHAVYPVIHQSNEGIFGNQEEMFGSVEPVKRKIDALPLIPKTRRSQGSFVRRKSSDHQLSIEQMNGGTGSRNSINQMSSLLPPSSCEPCLASAHPKLTTLLLDPRDPCYKKRKEDTVYKKKLSRTHYTGDDCTLIDQKEIEREVPLFRDVQNPVVMSTAVEIAPTPFMPGRSLSQDQSTMTSFDRIGLSLARANKRFKQPAIFKEDPRVGFDEEAEEEEVSVHHISRINSGALVHGDVARNELKSRVDEEVDLDEPEIKVDSILSEQPFREPTKKPGFFAELFKLFPCFDSKRTTSNKTRRPNPTQGFHRAGLALPSTGSQPLKHSPAGSPRRSSGYPGNNGNRKKSPVSLYRGNPRSSKNRRISMAQQGQEKRH